MAAGTLVPQQQWSTWVGIRYRPVSLGPKDSYSYLRLIIPSGTEANKQPTHLLQLMCKMLPLLGHDVAERVFLDKFCEICSSQNPLIREACPPSLCDFCAVVSQKSFEELLVRIFSLQPSAFWKIFYANLQVINFTWSKCRIF